nr:MAG TPA: major capsid protein [Caudoviricetes sp.]
MNLKAMIEKRNALMDEMDGLFAACKTGEEERAFSEEEAARFEELENEIRALDKTIEAAQAREKMERREAPAGESPAEIEARAFADYIMGRSLELRTGEQNMSMGNNGAIIPTTIAGRIIKAVRDRCPILAGATRYNVKGTLKVPVWGKANSTHDITVGYQSEFTEITADSGAFTSVDLGGYLAGALTLIGRSVENNGAFNVTDFIINQMAEEIAIWMEGQLLNGTGSSAATGATNTTNTLTAAAANAVTADELIQLQAKVKQAYQGNACWTMNPDTFTAIKQLKDGNNRYLLQDDVTGEFPYRLLGKPVYLSDNMPKVAASAKAVLYGDYSGLSVNFRENISIQVLREHYAAQHAIGVVSWFEFDSKVTDSQRLAVLAMKES